LLLYFSPPVEDIPRDDSIISMFTKNGRW